MRQLEDIEFHINGVSYRDLGSYMDNNEGVWWFCPKNDDDSWVRFLEISDPLIVFWVFAAIWVDHVEMPDNQGTKYLQKLDPNLLGVISKFKINYYPGFGDHSVLPDFFEDFNFGQYSQTLMDWDNPPEIRVDNTLVDYSEFMYDTHVFIKSEYYDQFMSDLHSLVNGILSAIEKRART